MASSDRNRSRSQKLYGSTMHSYSNSSSTSRPDDERPMMQLTCSLIQTYNIINANYYKKRKFPQESGIALRKKKDHAQLLPNNCHPSHAMMSTATTNTTTTTTTTTSRTTNLPPNTTSNIEAQSNNNTHSNSSIKDDKNSDDYSFSFDVEVFDGRYRIHGKKIGMGSFGQVVEGVDLCTGEKVAIKIIKKKKNFMTQAQTEIAILEMLHRHNHIGKNMIVTLKHTFIHKGHQCLVFELLSYNLYELLRSTQFRGIGFNLLRKFTRQILQSLEYLAHPSINVIHCDLKPENILLVHPKHSNIKIIDFGSSCLSQKQLYQYIQSRFYRSPEVLLGKKYTCAIDMWSLGCIMVEMHTGEPLFGGADQHDQLRRITNVLGMPPRELIEQANPTFRRQYFDEIVMVEGDNRLTDYRMKVRKNSTNNSQIIEENGLRSLRDIIGVDSGGPQGRRLGDTAHSAHHYHLFLDLVQRMLDYNPATRITPTEALRHAFLEPSPPSSETTNEKKSKSMRSSHTSDLLDDYEDEAIASNRVKHRRLHSYTENL